MVRSTDDTDVSQAATTLPRLQGPHQWRDWIEEVQDRAEELEIWEFIDPDGMVEFERPDEPGPAPQPPLPASRDPEPQNPDSLPQPAVGAGEQEIVNRNQTYETLASNYRAWQHRRQAYQAEKEDYIFLKKAWAHSNTLYEREWKTYELRRRRLLSLTDAVRKSLDPWLYEHLKQCPTLREKAATIRSHINLV